MITFGTGTPKSIQKYPKVPLQMGATGPPSFFAGGTPTSAAKVIFEGPESWDVHLFFAFRFYTPSYFMDMVIQKKPKIFLGTMFLYV